jgi:hypothetical protein
MENSTGLKPLGKPMRRLVAVSLLIGVGLLAGCDYIARRDLVPGKHTEADVRHLIGPPTLVWEHADGTKEWDYVRAPQGIETWRVSIGADGRYQGMTQLLTEQRFKQAGPGMTRGELERMFSRPSEVVRLPVPNEEVLSWRYQGEGGFRYLFNAHLDPGSGRAIRYTRMDDPVVTPGV